jgi:hypothetical protein
VLEYLKVRNKAEGDLLWGWAMKLSVTTTGLVKVLFNIWHFDI